MTYIYIYIYIYTQSRSFPQLLMTSAGIKEHRCCSINSYIYGKTPEDSSLAGF